MKKLRIGVVGAGGIAKVHLDCYSRIEAAEVVAVCDLDPVLLAAAAEKFGVKKTYASEADMLANEELDAVDVCTWNCNHAEGTIQALNAGLHVLCEKPMGINAQEAERMVEAAKKNNRLLMIGLTMRFLDETRIVKDFIDHDYLGDIYYSKATYLRRHGAPGGWFTDKSRSGGGPVIDLGVHVVDLTRYLMGKPKPLSVFASTECRLKNRPYLKNGEAWKPENATKEDAFTVEDFAVALIKYEGGKTTLLETSYSLNGEDVIEKALYGTKGGVVMDGQKMKICTVVNDFLADVTPRTSDYIHSQEAYTAEMAHFVDCALNGTPCQASAEDGLVVMRILDAIYESARTGHEVIL